MKQKNYHSCTVGQIVAGNFDTTKVFSRYHIDFCCHGNTPFAEACRNRGIDPEAVAHELDRFEEALHEHIHLENNIIFPRALELEKKEAI